MEEELVDSKHGRLMGPGSLLPVVAACRTVTVAVAWTPFVVEEALPFLAASIPCECVGDLTAVPIPVEGRYTVVRTGASGAVQTA